MKPIDPLMAAFEGDKRHARTSTPWELFHEASKVPPKDRDAQAATGDGLRMLMARRREESVNRVTRRAPLSSWFFYGRARVDLPFCESHTERGFSALARRRRSLSEFGDDPVSTEELAFLLASSAGVTHLHPVSGAPLRVAPASGGLYELELYLVVRSVEGLAPGLYHYHANTHSLAILGASDRIEGLGEAAAVPGPLQHAPLYCVWTSVMGRLDWKYGQRAYRFSHLNAGHAAQQMCLAATERGLACCPHGGFVDDELARVLDVDGISEFPIHCVAVGRMPRRAVAPSKPATGPRLRRFDRLDPGRPDGDWTALEAWVDHWYAAQCEGNTRVAREQFTALRARLPGDKTLADLDRWSRDAEIQLSIDPALVLVTPALWSETRRDGWRDIAGTASKRVAKWLGVGALPRVVLDLSTASPSPRTDNRERWLHRRVTLPREWVELEEPEVEVLTHEFAHAAYLPHHEVIAEGIAAAVGFSGEEHRLERGELKADTAAALFIWLRDREWPPQESGRVVAVAGSFVAWLCEQHGRDRFFAWANSFLYPAPQVEREAWEIRFHEVYGMGLQEGVHRWWAACQ